MQQVGDAAKAAAPAAAPAAAAAGGAADEAGVEAKDIELVMAQVRKNRWGFVFGCDDSLR